MAARHRNGRNRLGPQLIRQLPQLAVAQTFHVGRQRDPVKKGGKGTVCHNASNVFGAPQMARLVRTSSTEL
jgi:hypothetical protein